MDQLTCIIIDDELHASENLKRLVERMPRLKLLGTFLEPASALSFLQNSEKIDIIFSDINMPEIDGLSGAKLLRKYASFLVFVTGFREYALDAFAVGADAYLLKPIHFPVFADKITDIFEKYDSLSVGNNKKEKKEKPWIFIKNARDGSIVRLDITDIQYVQSMSNYLMIYTAKSMDYIVYNSLKDIGRTLTPFGFQRINKSTIVSLQHISKIVGNQIYLSGIVESFPIGRPYKDDLLKSISY